MVQLIWRSPMKGYVEAVDLDSSAVEHICRHPADIKQVCGCHKLAEMNEVLELSGGGKQRVCRCAWGREGNDGKSRGLGTIQLEVGRPPREGG